MKRVLQIAISLALLTWVVWGIDLSDVGAHFKSVQLKMLLLVPPLLVADRWLMSSKWRLLLRAVGVQISEWNCFRMYMVSSFVGLFLPATVGGDLSRAALAYKDGFPVAKVASSILVERLLGFAALVFMTLIGLVLLTTTYADVDVGVPGLLLSASLMMGAFVLVILISFNGWVKTWCLALMDSLSSRSGLVSKAAGYAAKLYRAYLEFSTQRLVLCVFFVLSCLEGLLIIVLGYVIALALHADVTFTYVLASFTIITFLIRLPISVDGFGIYEKGVQFFLFQVGVEQSLGLSVGVLFHLACFISILPGGLLLAFYRTKGR